MRLTYKIMLVSLPFITLFIGNIRAVGAFAIPKIGVAQRHHSISKLWTATGIINGIVGTQEEPQKPPPPQQQFNWFKAWYPLIPIEILDREKPHRFELLGQSIVVWYDGPVTDSGLFRSKKQRPRGAKRSEEGKWRAFIDECPHRKVPLSEGRVEDDGTLLCSYHAWRFNGDGACVAVPSIDSEEALKRVLNSPKSSCNTFPTKIINGLLFVWPSSDSNAVLESELTPVQHRPALSNDKNLMWEGPWTSRVLPYGADFLVENVVDPAHVPVSHHNVVGSRYMEQTMDMTIHTPLTKDGFAITGTYRLGPYADVTYYAPSFVVFDVPISTDGAKLTLELYVSPSRPGFCNHVGRTVMVQGKSGKVPWMLRLLTLPMPTWVSHVRSSVLLSQDGLFLHHQERSMAWNGQYTTLLQDGQDAYKYSQAVLPVNSDLGVILYRNWIRKFAGGRIPYKNNPTMPHPSNDVVFDVWNSHTKHCKYCQDAVQRFKMVRLAAWMSAACCAIIRPLGSTTGTLVSSLALAGVGLAVNKLIGMFYRYEYSHAHND